MPRKRTAEKYRKKCPPNRTTANVPKKNIICIIINFKLYAEISAYRTAPFSVPIDLALVIMSLLFGLGQEYQAHHRPLLSVPNAFLPPASTVCPPLPILLFLD